MLAENVIQVIDYWVYVAACNVRRKTEEQSQEQLTYRDRHQADWQYCCCTCSFASSCGDQS